MNPAEIAADEAVIAGATEGPWVAADDLPGIVETCEHNPRTVCGCGNSVPKQQNADFIAAARTRWPLYVAEVKRLKTPVKVSRVSFCASLDSNRGLCVCGDFVNGWQKFCPNCGVPLMWEER